MTEQCLRLGVLQNGRLLEERLLPRRPPRHHRPVRPVHLDTGRGPPPRPWRLFQIRRGRPLLRLAPDMEARLAVNGHASTVPPSPRADAPAFCRSSLPRAAEFRSGGRHPVPVARPDAGAAAAAAACLGAGSLRASLDRGFTALAIASLLCHLAGRAVPAWRRLAQQPDQMAQLDRFVGMSACGRDPCPNPIAAPASPTQTPHAPAVRQPAANPNITAGRPRPRPARSPPTSAAVA
jgi:hypothetical protein